eukprot:10402945-Lingulodinium_polyedra.AAC.1
MGMYTHALAIPPSLGIQDTKNAAAHARPTTLSVGRGHLPRNKNIGCQRSPAGKLKLLGTKSPAGNGLRNNSFMNNCTIA